MEERDMEGAAGYRAEDEEDGAEGFFTSSIGAPPCWAASPPGLLLARCSFQLLGFSRTKIIARFLIVCSSSQVSCPLAFVACPWPQVDAREAVFWVFDDVNRNWYQRRLQGHRTRKGQGKGKEKRKGKGKGRGGRKLFSDQEEKEKQKAAAEKAEPTWWVKKKMIIGTMKMTRGPLIPGMKNSLQKIPGMTAIAPKKTCTTWTSAAISRRKAKARKERKERKEVRKARVMKEKVVSLVMEKGNRTMSS